MTGLEWMLVFILTSTGVLCGLWLIGYLRFPRDDDPEQ